MTTMNDDFYEDDEPIADVHAAWKRGEKGVTTGKKDLNQRARSIVDSAVERLDQPEPPRYRLTLVSGLMGARPKTVNEQSPNAIVQEPEYQVS